MSRVIVRTALTQWLQAADIFDQILAAKVQFQAPTIPAGSNNYRCNAYVLLSQAHESRIAMGGPYSGMKQIDYIARISMHFWSIDPDWVAAQDRFDELIDEVKEQVRSGGRTLGRPDVILQAGEWTYGIDDAVSEPVSLVAGPSSGGQMYQTADISFEVTELIFS